MIAFGSSHAAASQIEWLRCLPFLLLPVACLAVFWVGWSWAAVMIALGTLFLRVFGLTASYLRYFSRRAFKTSRWFQLVGAILGATAVQRGPLWWAAHHRSHSVAHRWGSRALATKDESRNNFLLALLT